MDAYCPLKYKDKQTSDLTTQIITFKIMSLGGKVKKITLLFLSFIYSL